MAHYNVIANCWMYGKWYKVGDKIDLNPKQAKYEIYSGTIAPIEAPKPAPAPAPAKKVEPKAAAPKTEEK
jgi:hypothetical protein